MQQYARTALVKHAAFGSLHVHASARIGRRRRNCWQHDRARGCCGTGTDGLLQSCRWTHAKELIQALQLIAEEPIKLHHGLARMMRAEPPEPV